GGRQDVARGAVEPAALARVAGLSQLLAEQGDVLLRGAGVVERFAARDRICDARAVRGDVLRAARDRAGHVRGARAGAHRRHEANGETVGRMNGIRRVASAGSLGALAVWLGVSALRASPSTDGGARALPPTPPP